MEKRFDIAEIGDTIVFFIDDKKYLMEPEQALVASKLLSDSAHQILTRRVGDYEDSFLTTCS